MFAVKCYAKLHQEEYKKAYYTPPLCMQSTISGNEVSIERQGPSSHLPDLCEVDTVKVK